MAMAEPRGWDHDEQDAHQLTERLRVVEERARAAEEQRLEAEGRCFAAERRRLDAERQLEQVERLLDEARCAGVRMQQLVGELSGLAANLRRALQWRAPASGASDETAAAEHRAEMADALAAAVERLRARWPIDDPTVRPEWGIDRRSAEAKADGPPSVEAGARVAASARPAAPVPGAVRPAHKHSMSAIARWRNTRKQRHSR